MLTTKYNLNAKIAEIDAVRAAVGPGITLTSATGAASDDLSGLFCGGSGAWSFGPSISPPFVDGGANLAKPDPAPTA